MAPDPRGGGDLAKEVEPTGDPGRESSVLWVGEHCRPKIRPAARRMCAAYLTHGQADHTGEES